MEIFNVRAQIENIQHPIFNKKCSGEELLLKFRDSNPKGVFYLSIECWILNICIEGSKKNHCASQSPRLQSH